MPVNCEPREARYLIRLEGEVDISSAAELKKRLLEALRDDGHLHLDLEGATDLDITALQLLWAAERQARGSGKGFALVGRLPETVNAALNEAGLEDFLRSAQSQ